MMRRYYLWAAAHFFLQGEQGWELHQGGPVVTAALHTTRQLTRICCGSTENESTVEQIIVQSGHGYHSSAAEPKAL